MAIERLRTLPESEWPRALESLRQRNATLHARVLDALWGETVTRPGGPPAAFCVGDRIRDKFEVISLLGEGASGSVFRAVDTTHVGDGEFTSREVALKVSRVDTGHDRLNRDLLHKEARLLRRLKHPQLPVVEAFFEDQGRWVLVMEYIAGDSLQKRRRDRTGPFSVATVLPWLRDTLRVLDYLHTLSTRPAQAKDRGPVADTPIFHRDIKPANLILDAHDHLYVVDLGIARSGMSELSSVAPSGVGAGSPGYAAPEVERGEETLPQSDLYSVGMTALTLLTRYDALEFSARKRSDALHAGVPDPLHEALDRADLPEALREWVRTATSLVPSRRFGSAAAMMEALDRPRISTGATKRSPLSRLPGRAVVAGLVFTTAAVGAWAAWPVAPVVPAQHVARPAAETPVLTNGARGLAAETVDPLAASPPASVPRPAGAPLPLGTSSAPPAAAPSLPAPVPTGTLRATLLGEDGTPLVGARATMVGTSVSQTADALGDVTLPDVPPGTYTVEVQAEGYVARQFRVEILSGESVSRTLQFDLEDLSTERY